MPYMYPICAAEHVLADLHEELSIVASVKKARYPFYVVPFKDHMRHWSRFKRHDDCLYEDACIKFQDIQDFLRT